MRRLIFIVVTLVSVLFATLVPVQAQELIDTVRDAVIASVKEKTGRTLVLKGELSFAMQPQPLMTAKNVELSNPEGFEAGAFITMEQIDITFDLVAALTGNMVINGFVMKKPVISLVVDKTGRNNWSFGPSALQAGVFEVSDGQITYLDKRSETRHTFDDVDLKISAPTISDTLKAIGTLEWNHEKMDLVSSLATPELFNQGKAAALSIKLKGTHFTTDLSGKFLKQKDGFKLSEVTLLADDMKATGKMSFRYGKKRPNINAVFKLDRLLLTKYLGGDAKKPKRKLSGWSKDTIDLSGLKAIDGSFKFSTGAVHYKKFKTGAASLAVKLKRGVLNISIPKLALYGGAAKADLSVDSRKAKPALKFNGTVRKVKARPFLRDAADIQKIEGRTNLGFNLTSIGNTQYAIMQALRGTADVNFRKGALLGINIGRILRAVQRGKTSGFAKGGKTPFGKIVAKFRFRKGIGTNRKLRMSGGEVRVSGGGRVRMPNQTLGYRVHPSLVGRGGISVLGINVPIIISGPWSNPRIYPDLPGFLDTPEIALKGLTTVGKGGIKGVVGVVKTITSPIGKIITSPFKKLF